MIKTQCGIPSITITKKDATIDENSVHMNYLEYSIDQPTYKTAMDTLNTANAASKLEAIPDDYLAFDTFFRSVTA